MCLCNFLQNAENRQVFTQFLECKFGYGRWAAPFWFVGMEEGGGQTCADVLNRVQRWRLPGQQDWNELNDLHTYCERIGVNPIAPQPTWRKLIQLYAASGQNVGEVPVAQGGGWGGNTGPVCLAEISPLPSPGVGKWHYSFCPVEDPELQNRLSTRERLLASNDLGINRSLLIRQRLVDFKRVVRCVVFYGHREPFPDFFNLVAQPDLAQPPIPLCQLPTIQGTAFRGEVREFEGSRIACVYAPHPRAQQGQWADANLQIVGQWITQQIQNG